MIAAAFEDIRDGGEFGANKTRADWYVISTKVPRNAYRYELAAISAHVCLTTTVAIAERETVVIDQGGTRLDMCDTIVISTVMG
jgi:hypothetical protein